MSRTDQVRPASPSSQFSNTSPRRESASAILPTDDQPQRPASVTIGLSPDAVFAFVRDFTNFPHFVRNLKEVKMLATKVAQFTFEHDGTTETCDIERLADVQDQMVAWHTIGESLKHTGVLTVEPAPGNRGTVVSMKMNFAERPEGKVRGVLAFFLGSTPKNESYINLRQLKAYLETGEVPTIQGQPSGRDQ